MYIVFFRSIFHIYKRSSFTVLRSQIITLNLYEKHCETKVDQKKLTVFFFLGGGVFVSECVSKLKDFKQ